jgi:DNA-binding NarL/FixJ family response regulator
VRPTGERAGSSPCDDEVGAALRVVLADDDADFVLILRARLNLLPGIEVVATAGDGSEVVEAVAHTQPDVAVVDLLMPDVDGFAALEELARSHPSVGRVAYTAVASSAAHERTAALGAELVVKSRDASALVEAIRRSAARAGDPGGAGAGTPTAVTS